MCHDDNINNKEPKDDDEYLLLINGSLSQHIPKYVNKMCEFLLQKSYAPLSMWEWKRLKEDQKCKEKWSEMTKQKFQYSNRYFTINGWCSHNSSISYFILANPIKCYRCNAKLLILFFVFDRCCCFLFTPLSTHLTSIVEILCPFCELFVKAKQKKT